VFDCEEAVDMRELAPLLRGGARGTFAICMESYDVRPPMSPTSVEVLSIDITPALERCWRSARPPIGT